MKKVNDIRTGRHCVFLLHAHLVFVTKYRYGVFTKIILDGLKEIFASVCRDFEAELIEFDGEEDHVHLLVVYPPKVAISSLFFKPMRRRSNPVMLNPAHINSFLCFSIHCLHSLNFFILFLLLASPSGEG